MATRRGSFSGTSLDPFGGSRGGLGRYNVSGATISSLAQYEAYAVQIAWSNGLASNEDYLASLQKLVDLANPGTQERITAENRLHDAQYTIGRNALVRDVNNALDHPTRQAALTKLLGYEQAYLGTMTAAGSQAYQQQQDRVASTRAELRTERYNAVLEDVNRGKAPTTALLNLARTLSSEAGSTSDPDVVDWNKTILDLTDRVKQEALAQQYQDYQRHRVAGATVLATIDARLAELDPSSEEYKALARSREDFASQVTNDTANQKEADVQSLRADGKMTDQAFLAYLNDAYRAAPPGTAEWIQAGTRLREYTFSLAEDKLRYDVSKGTRSVSDLVSFYRNYLAGMDPGSERYRTISGAIDSLLGSSSGGGGGGGGGASAKTISLLRSAPLIDGLGALADLTGTKQAPPGFADLFRIDPTNSVARNWWTHNRSSMMAAFSDGAASWTYYDQRGNAYQLPFSSGFMSEVDSLNLAYMQLGLRSATSESEAQTWVGRIIEASNSLQSHGAAYAIDTFDRTWKELDTAKQKALASGQLALYYSLTQQQHSIAKLALTSPYLTESNLQHINTVVVAANPQDLDPSSPTYNERGDPVLTAFLDGTIAAQYDNSTGEITSARLDPKRGFLMQSDGGQMKLVTVDQSDPNQVRTDPVSGELIPRYYDTNTPITVASPFGGSVTVWQPVIRPGQQKAGDTVAGTPIGLPVYGSNSVPTAPTQGGRGRVGPPGGVTVNFDPVPLVDPTSPQNARVTATLPVYQTTTWERVNGVMTKVTWVSLSDPVNGAGGEWVRLPGPGGKLPRVVIPPNVTVGASGHWQIDGKDATLAQVAASAKWWASPGTMDFGGPDMRFDHRATGPDGTLDLRPAGMIQAEERVIGGTHGPNRGQLEADTTFNQQGLPHNVSLTGNRGRTAADPNAIAARVKSGDLLPMAEIRRYSGALATDRLAPLGRASLTGNLGRLPAPRPPSLGPAPTPAPIPAPAPSTLTALAPLKTATLKPIGPVDLTPPPSLTGNLGRTPAPAPTKAVGDYQRGVQE